MNDKLKRKSKPQANRHRVWLISGVSLIMLALAGFLAFQRTVPVSAQPMVAFLLETDGVNNIWLADSQNPTNRRALTDLPQGVEQFDVDATGDVFVFTPQSTQPEIYRVGQDALPEALTNCGEVDAYCRLALVSADGRYVAYQRIDVPTVPGEPPQHSVWVISLADGEAHQMLSNTRADVTPVRWLTDTQLVVTIGDETERAVVDVESGQQLDVFIAQAVDPATLIPNNETFPVVDADENAQGVAYTRLTDSETLEVWVYDYTTGEFRLIAQSAHAVRWVDTSP